MIRSQINNRLMEVAVKQDVSRIILCSESELQVEVIKSVVSPLDWLSSEQLEIIRRPTPVQPTNDHHDINNGLESSLLAINQIASQEKVEKSDESAIILAISPEFRATITKEDKLLIERVIHCAIRRGESTFSTHSKGTVLPEDITAAVRLEDLEEHRATLSDSPIIKALLSKWKSDRRFRFQTSWKDLEEVVTIGFKKVYMMSKTTLFPDFPKAGINFLDYTYMLSDPTAFNYIADTFVQAVKAIGWDKKATKIMGMDARGFIHGSTLARDLGLGLLIARKKGKLPGIKAQVSYSTEYSDDVMELCCGTIEAGDKIILADDFIATGGTFRAGIELVRQTGRGEIVGCVALMHAEYLNEKAKLKMHPVEYFYCM